MDIELLGVFSMSFCLWSYVRGRYEWGGNQVNLFIQIPCLNEAETLPVVLKELPRQVEGFAKVEWLVIDDGSQAFYVLFFGG